MGGAGRGRSDTGPTRPGIDLMWLMAASARLLVVRLLLLSLSSAVSSARGKHSSRKLEELLDLTTIPGLSFRAPQVETVPGVQLWWPQYLQSPLAPRTDLAAIEDQLAIAYIAIGNEVTHEMLLPLSISTVRRAGGFRGDVFVITDRPDCVPKVATAVLAPSNPSDEPIFVYGKLFKQRLLQLLPLSPAHQFVWYMDLDIFIGAPLTPFFLSATRQAVREGAHIALFLENTGLNGQVRQKGIAVRPLLPENITKVETLSRKKQLPSLHASLFHGGAFLVRRGFSEPCLERWAMWNHDGSDRDQPMLTSIIAHRICNASALPQEHFGQPAPQTANVYFTFNHFTRNGRLLGMHGVTTEMLIKAGETLFALNNDTLVRSWWKEKSPLCS